MVFKTNSKNEWEMLFCIIFSMKICEKIIPNIEKSTTQLENMCYNIVGKKRVGEVCSEVKHKKPKDFSSFCPNRMGQRKNLLLIYTQ